MLKRNNEGNTKTTQNAEYDDIGKGKGTREKVLERDELEIQTKERKNRQVCFEHKMRGRR